MSYASEKLRRALVLAKHCSRDSWQHSDDQEQRRTFQQIRREAMQDARYWRAEVQKEAGRLYHVVAVNNKTGKTVRCTMTPEPHDVARRLMARFSRHPGRRIQLQEYTA